MGVVPIIEQLTRSSEPDLFVRVYPCDEPAYVLLLVHGTAGHGGCYDDFARSAAGRGASVWAPDLRGHGESGGARGNFTMEGFLADVDAVAMLAAERTGLPVVLLGASQGGEVAFHALASSDAIAGAVCMNILLARELPLHARMRLIQSAAVGRVAAVVGDRLRIPLRKVIDFAAAYREGPGLWQEKQRDPLYVWSYGLASYRSVFTYDPPQPASENAKPVLVAVGEDDPIVGAEHCRACFDRIGGPTSFYAMPRAGHQLMNFHRERFADVVDDWARHAIVERDASPWTAPTPRATEIFETFLADQHQRDSHDESGYALSPFQRALSRVANGTVERGVEFFRTTGDTQLGEFVSTVVAQIDRAAWPTFAPFLPEAPSRPRLAVLGCGDGRVIDMLRAAEPRLATWEIVGVDVDPDAVARGRAKGTPRTSFEVLDARTLGTHHSDAFDAIYSHGIFDHCAGHRELLASCHDALRPGGVFMYVTPDRNLATWLRFVAIGPRFVFGLGHYSTLHDFRRFPRPRELDQLARDVGLEVVGEPDTPDKAFHRGIDYRAGGLAIARAVRRRDVATLDFEVTRTRWWLAGGFPGEFTGVLRRAAP